MSGRSLAPPTEQSIVEILAARAAEAPDRKIFGCLNDDGVETETLTYALLLKRARAISARLQSDLAPGDRALLVYPPGLECIAALMGCFLSGVVAVPACPPRAELLDPGMLPLERIAADCTASALLTTGPPCEVLADLAPRRPALAKLRLLDTAGIDASSPFDFRDMPPARSSTALLQYTSGSTGDPKGVVITHGNILASEHAIQLAFHHHTRDEPGEGVCWLPYFHDMGLIGCILQALYVDGPMHMLSPLVLLQRPFVWLDAISRTRAHTSGGPNFAFELCLRRITDEQKSRLDLSSWRVAAIGAEPVSASVMERFAHAFASCGFRYEAFYPCYGLAEATLLVTGGDRDRPPVVRSFAETSLAAGEPAEPQAGATHRGTRPIVGCGHVWTSHELRIVDPETGVERAPGEVGEIWFRGPSVAGGYWGRPDETEADFQARLASGGGPFLRTGDFGFLLDDELFVCGRLKDVIVIHGRNLYPQDVEATVADVCPAFLRGRCAAFGAHLDDEERLIVVQEIDRARRVLDAGAVSFAVRGRIAAVHQVQLHELVLVRRGSLPLTTSGKVRRFEARERYLAGRLVRWQPPEIV